MRLTSQPFARPASVLEREAELEAVEELIGASTRGGWLLAIEGSELAESDLHQ
jgi:hypothetical protein